MVGIIITALVSVVAGYIIGCLMTSGNRDYILKENDNLKEENNQLRMKLELSECNCVCFNRKT